MYSALGRTSVLKRVVVVSYCAVIEFYGNGDFLYFVWLYTQIHIQLYSTSRLAFGLICSSSSTILDILRPGPEYSSLYSLQSLYSYSRIDRVLSSDLKAGPGWTRDAGCLDR